MGNRGREMAEGDLAAPSLPSGVVHGTTVREEGMQRRRLRIQKVVEN